MQHGSVAHVFARNLAQVINLRHLTVSSAARQWKLPQKTVEAIVKGMRIPSLDTAERVAHAAGFELWQMLHKQFDPANPPVIQPMTPEERRFYADLRALMDRMPQQ